MANIVELIIKGTDSSGHALASSVKNLHGLDSALSAVTRRLAGIVSVGALVTLAKSAINTGSALQDMSEKFGVSASDLSALSYPAKMAGVELEGVGNAFKFMQKNIAAASNPTSDQARAFKLLGVSLDELKGKLPMQQFLRLSDAFSRLERDENRTAMALALFGRAGADVLPVLEKGSVELNKMMKAAKDLGATLSEEEIKKLDHYGDVIDLIGIRAKATAGRGLVELIEKIKAVGEAAAKYGPGIEGVISDMGLLEFGRGAKSFKAPALPTPPPKVKAGNIEEEKAAAEKAKKAAEDAAKEKARIEEDGQKRALKLLDDRTEALAAFYGDSTELARILAEEDIARGEKAIQIEKDRIAYAQELKGTMDMMGTYDPEMDLAEGMANLGGVVKEVSPEVQRMMDEWYQKTYALADLYATVFRGEDGVIADLANAAINAFHGMTDALTDFVMTGKLRFKDFANSVIADLARIAIQQSIVGPLAQGLMGAFGFTPPPARAYGGPVTAGNAYMVGERGPELFVPSSSGNIVPGGGGGNGNVTVNIKNQSGTPVSARATSVPDINGMVIDIVLDAARRDVGGFRTVLMGT